MPVQVSSLEPEQRLQVLQTVRMGLLNPKRRQSSATGDMSNVVQAKAATISSLEPEQRLQVLQAMPEVDRAAVLVTLAETERKRLLKELKRVDPAMAGLTVEFIR